MIFQEAIKYSLGISLIWCCCFISCNKKINCPDPFKVKASTDKSLYLLGETASLSVNFTDIKSIIWTGPEGYTSTEKNPKIKIEDASQLGNYVASINNDECGEVPLYTEIIIDTILPCVVAKNHMESTNAGYNGAITNITYQHSDYSFIIEGKIGSTDIAIVIINKANITGGYNLVTSGGLPSQAVLTVGDHYIVNGMLYIRMINGKISATTCNSVLYATETIVELNITTP